MRPCALLRHNRHRTGRSRSGASQLQETKQPRAEERMGGDAMNACLSQSRSNALIPPRRRTWIIAEAHLGLPLLGGRRILVLRHHDPEALPGLPLLEGIRFLVLQPISTLSTDATENPTQSGSDPSSSVPSVPSAPSGSLLLSPKQVHRMLNVAAGK